MAQELEKFYTERVIQRSSGVSILEPPKGMSNLDLLEAEFRVEEVLADIDSMLAAIRCAARTDLGSASSVVTLFKSLRYCDENQ